MHAKLVSYEDSKYYENRGKINDEIIKYYVPEVKKSNFLAVESK